MDHTYNDTKEKLRNMQVNSQVLNVLYFSYDII